MRGAFFLTLGLAACGGPAPSAPSAGAVERACEAQRQKRSFDRGCGVVVMSSANTAECRRNGAPAGTVHVKVTFANDGTVPEVIVDYGNPPETRNAVEACLVAKFRALKMPPFEGPRVGIGKTVTID
jgi:hypothetical protein